MLGQLKIDELLLNMQKACKYESMKTKKQKVILPPHLLFKFLLSYA